VHRQGSSFFHYASIGRGHRAGACGFLIPNSRGHVRQLNGNLRQPVAKEARMSKKNHPSGGKSSKPATKNGGFKQPFSRGTPLSRRPPRQPGR
jgi:hypothetical protein